MFGLTRARVFLVFWYVLIKVKVKFTRHYFQYIWQLIALRFEGNKINCYSRDQSLSDLIYSARRKTFFRVRIYGNKSCERSTFVGNSVLLPSDVIDFAMLPAHSFWRETVSLLDVMWPRSKQWERALLGKKFQLYDNSHYSLLKFYIYFFSIKRKVIKIGVLYVYFNKKEKWWDKLTHHHVYFWLSKVLGPCPNNWIHLQGSCYNVPSKSLSWTAAKSDCEALGSKLAIVTSQAEQQALVSKISQNVWIGLWRDPNVHSRWLWVDGSIATYTHWPPGEPNDAGGVEDCAHMFPPAGKWNDLACSSSLKYLCETNGRQHHDCVLNIVLIIMVYPVHGCS